MAEKVEKLINLERLQEFKNKCESQTDSAYMKKGTDYVTAGQLTGTTVGEQATVEGIVNTASADYSHAEGQGNTAVGEASHVEGINTNAGNADNADAQAQHAEGNKTSAIGANSHAQNLGTIASGDNQTVAGKYNVSDADKAVIIGNGTDDTNRSNAYELDWDGNAKFAGTVTDGQGQILKNYDTGNTTDSGLTKLYNTTGTSGDGAMDQSTTTAELNKKIDISTPVVVAVALDYGDEDTEPANVTNNATLASKFISEIAIDGNNLKVTSIDNGNKSTTESLLIPTSAPIATNTTTGTVKLYTDLDASNTDGSVDQATLVTKFAAIVKDYTDKISSIHSFDIVLVKEDTLPETGEENKVYLFPASKAEEDNSYEEFIWYNNKWESIGYTQIDLSGYYTKTEVDTAITDANKSNINNITNEGSTITYTKQDGTTGSITVPNTEYNPATAETAGLSKLYTLEGQNEDGAMTQLAVTNALGGKLGKEETAKQATSDSAGNQINTTYIKSVSAEGTTITVTKGDGTTSTFDTQDTTYVPATDETAGLVKLFNDAQGTSTEGTMTQNAIIEFVNSIKGELVKSIGEKTSFTLKVVDTLPETGESNIIYLTPEKAETTTTEEVVGASETKDVYAEYVWVTDTYEKLGTTDFNPDQYSTKDQVSSDIKSAHDTSITNFSIEGTTITITWGNGTTQTFETQDNNTEYDIATNAKAGIGKLYTSTGSNTDGSMTQNAITAELDKKLGTSAVAFGANQDGVGQNISNTYIKDITIDGTTVTVQRGDNTTYTRTTQDTTYETGNAETSGVTKLYAESGANTDGTMTQAAINTYVESVRTDLKEAIGKVNNFDVQPVDVLPDSGVPYTIYLIPSPRTEDKDSHLEYIWIADGDSGYYEQVGSTAPDLSGYSTTSQIEEKITTVNAGNINSITNEGSTITYTKQDGTTGSITVPDTTYEQGTAAQLGLTKLYTLEGQNEDGALTQKATANLIDTKITENSNKYVKSIGPSTGTSVKYTLGDGTESTFETQDTTYETGNTTESGLTKLYNTTGTAGDGAMDQSTTTAELNKKIDVKTPVVVAVALDYGDEDTEPAATVNNATLATKFVSDIAVEGNNLKVTTIDNGNKSTTENLIISTNISDASDTTSGIAKLYKDLDNANTDGSVDQATLKTKFESIVKDYTDKIGSIHSFDIVLITDTTLPTTGEANKIYLFPSKKTETDNSYEEYIWYNDKWELIGNTQIDLSGYYTKTEVDTAISTSNSSNINGLSADGSTVTFTKQDGTSDSFTLPNTEYDVATAETAGITKLYTLEGQNADGAMTQLAVTNALGGKLGKEDTAKQATSDAAGNQIDTTYIKEVSADGTTITITKGDGTTSTFETQDTTYTPATDSQAGLVKIFNDAQGASTEGTMTQNAIVEFVNSIKDELVKSIGEKTNFTIQVVDTLPDVGQSNIIYITPEVKEKTTTSTTKTTETPVGAPTTVDTYAEYVWVTDKYEKLGTTDFNPDQYSTKDQVSTDITAAHNKSITGFSIAGTTVTVTWGDGSSQTYETQDNNTEYDTATDKVAGIGKLYTSTGANTDGSMTQSAITTELGKKLDTSAVAYGANQDSIGQNISDTYIKDITVSGTTLTIQRGNNTTYTRTTQDTTYETGSDTVSGITKLYADTGSNTDGTMTQSAINTYVEGVRTELKNAIGKINNFDVQPVDALPDVGVPYTIYLISSGSTADKDSHLEYIWVADSTDTGYYEQVGSTAPDLSSYSTTSQVEEKINSANANNITDITNTGSTINFTKQDGSSGSITVPNTTYEQGTAAQLGLTKLYTLGGDNEDGALTQKATTSLIDTKISENSNKYIKSIGPVTGTSVSYTFGDGTTGAFDTTDTTYETGNTETAGITKLYSAEGDATDGAMTQAATKALNGTSVKSVAIVGRTVTMTLGNGDTDTQTTQDTSYEVGNETTAGISKLYTGTGENTDGAMTQNAVSTALSGKLDSDATAVAAEKDGNGNVISEYINTVTQGATEVTFTKGDGTANQKITTGNETVAGVTKLYTGTGTNTDGAMTQSAVNDYVEGVRTSINTAIGKINSFDVIVLGDSEALPDQGVAHTIYFLPDANSTETNNSYSEYLWLEDKSYFEKIGSASLNMSEIYTKTEVDQKIATAHNESVTGVVVSGTTITITKGDGTTSDQSVDVPEYNNFSGATDSAAGKAGLVPAPEAGATDKVLLGDGTWGTMSNVTVGKAETADAATTIKGSSVSINAIADNTLIDFGDEE